MTVIPDGKICYCGKKGCLDAYCSAAILSGAAEGKLGKFFELLEKKDKGQRKYGMSIQVIWLWH